jgi:hypothetical protein
MVSEFRLVSQSSTFQWCPGGPWSAEQDRLVWCILITRALTLLRSQSSTLSKRVGMARPEASHEEHSQRLIGQWPSPMSSSLGSWTQVTPVVNAPVEVGSYTSSVATPTYATAFPHHHCQLLTLSSFIIFGVTACPVSDHALLTF